MQLQAVEYGQVQTAGNLIAAESHSSLKKFKHQKLHPTVWIHPTYKYLGTSKLCAVFSSQRDTWLHSLLWEHSQTSLAPGCLLPLL